MTSNEIQVGSVWRGRHQDILGRYLRVLAVAGERVCVQHQSGRRVWGTVSKFTGRYEPTSGAAAPRFPESLGPLPGDGGQSEPEALAGGEAQASPRQGMSTLAQVRAFADVMNSATPEQLAEAARQAGADAAALGQHFEQSGAPTPLAEAPARPQRAWEPATTEPTYARPGLVILSAELTDRVLGVVEQMQARLRGTGARVSVDTLLADVLTDEWAASVLGRVGG